MVNAVAEDQILKIHRAGDGSIWYVDGARAAARSPLGVHDFPDGPEAARAARVRILGTWENAPLVARFYTFKMQRKVASIAVASPLMGRTRGERGDAGLMLARMREFPWPGSLGGYHEVTHLDYTAYLLATFFQYDLASPERVNQVLDGHPLWSYLGFIPHLDRLQVARLIATILDPRWYARWDDDFDEWDPRAYVNASAKDAARLNQFLGLAPATMADARAGHTSRHADRARMALAAWKTTDAPPAAALGEDPRYFLWRRWRTYDSAAKADLRVTQLFVDFLRQCWLDAAYMTTIRHSQGGQPDGLFVPGYFFREEEAKAFSDHLAHA
jgi:hypothetical protein